MDQRRTYAEGDRVEILVATRGTERWMSGVVTGSRASPWEEEDFQRYDVEAGSAMTFCGCHPDCMRIARAEGRP